jgi:PAS domain S-box-containing protein
MNNRPVKVLAIDDNADNLITLKVLVKEHFPEAIVFTAQSGKKGLQIASDEDPDVILLDVVMPEMDGFEVCRKIKNDKKLSTIPVVFVTALKEDKETRAKAMSAGADAFLSKPVDETELTVQIRAMVKIKDAVVQKLNENQRLAAIVEEKTRELKNTNLATMNLLEDLKHEIEARRESEAALRNSEEKYRIIAESSRIIAETQLKMLKSDNIEDLFKILAESIHSIIGEGIVATVKLNDSDKSMQFVSCAGLGDMVSKVIDLLGFDPTKKQTTLDKMSEKELRKYSTGMLVKLENGLHDLLENLVPEKVSMLVQKLLGVRNVFTIGLVEKDNPTGGVVILAKKDISDHHDDIEKITGQAALAVQKKKAEEELEKSNRIFNHSIDMLCIAGFDGYFKTLNPSWERVLGWSTQELLSKPWVEFTHPDDVEKTKNVKAVQLDNGDQVYHFENRYICKDGSVKWLSWNSFPYPAEGIMFGVARDITEQKKIEQELLDRERRLQQIFDILPIGLWFADETGKLIMGNPAGVKIWGAEPTVGIEEYGVFKARKLPENIEIKGEEWALAKTVKDGVIIENELLEIDAFDGKKKVILNYTAPILDDENKVTGAIVINQEVTEKYKYEEELKKSEEKYRLMAENMGNVITMLDMELNYTYVTPNIEKVQGFTVEESLHKTLERTMTPESFQIVMKVFEEEMAIEMSGTGDPKRSRVLELEEYRKDGSTIWMENVLSFVRNEAGIPIGILSVSRDVTERRMAHEEKARLTEQLYHAQKMESVGTLAGGIAHDFNNLLQVIGGYTSMLLTDQKRDVPEIEKLKTIEKAVDRASELVSNLLNFSRKNVSMKKEVDLNNEITASVKILERTIPKMVKIKTDFDRKISKISADPVQIEQVMLNLGKNSSDAMPDGGEILIKTENVENEKGKYVLMTFSDTGQGMDQAIKDHVFDPFFTTKEVGKGTGLGLASVYGIVESHGGHIHCKSELGKGTVFYLYFQAVDTVSDNRKVITEKTEKLEGNETVLIVDDEKNIRDIYSTALKEFGYKIITANSGEDALLIFNENHQSIDLVILDLGMPGMGGFKCMLEMKKTVPDSKIIIASGYSEVFQTEDMLKSGASGFIQKPFKLKSVLEKIREVLDENTQPEHN